MFCGSLQGCRGEEAQIHRLEVREDQVTLSEGRPPPIVSPELRGQALKDDTLPVLVPDGVVPGEPLTQLRRVHWPNRHLDGEERESRITNLSVLHVLTKLKQPCHEFSRPLGPVL